MPGAWRAHVIEARLRSAGVRAEVEELDIYALPAELRNRVTDVLVAERAEFPVVIVNGTVACHSGIDTDAVLRAAKEVPSGGSCCC